MCILYVQENNYKSATRKIMASKDDFVVGRCVKFPNTQTKIITLTHKSIIISGLHIVWLYNPRIYNEQVLKKLSNTMLRTTLGTRFLIIIIIIMRTLLRLIRSELQFASFLTSALNANCHLHTPTYFNPRKKPLIPIEQ